MRVMPEPLPVEVLQQKHLKKIWNMFKVDNKEWRYKNDCTTWTYYTSFSSASIVDLEYISSIITN